VPHGDGEGVAAKLTWAEVDEIRVLHTAEHLSYEKIAEKYGVTASTIRAIITFKSWKPEQREGNRPRIGGPRKLTQEQAIEIRNLYEIEHFSQHKLAKRYGVAVSTIAQIVRYKTWNPEQVSLPKNALPWLLSGEAARHAKLTWQQVDEIRRLHTTEHLSNQRLGEMYGVTEGAIWHIVKGKTWKPENDPRRKEQPT